jgi:hypothetical protein
VTYTVNADAPAGYTLVIEQAQGKCGGNTVNTEMYRITHQKDGIVQNVRYELSYPNGTVVPIDVDNQIF